MVIIIIVTIRMHVDSAHTWHWPVYCNMTLQATASARGGAAYRRPGRQLPRGQRIDYAPALELHRPRAGASPYPYLAPAIAAQAVGLVLPYVVCVHAGRSVTACVCVQHDIVCAAGGGGGRLWQRPVRGQGQLVLGCALCHHADESYGRTPAPSMPCLPPLAVFLPFNAAPPALFL